MPLTHFPVSLFPHYHRDVCLLHTVQSLPAAASEWVWVGKGRAGGCVGNQMIKGNLEHLCWKTYELMIEGAADQKLANVGGGVPKGTPPSLWRRRRTGGRWGGKGGG